MILPGSIDALSSVCFGRCICPILLGIGLVPGTGNARSFSDEFSFLNRQLREVPRARLSLCHQSKNARQTVTPSKVGLLQYIFAIAIHLVPDSSRFKAAGVHCVGT